MGKSNTLTKFAYDKFEENHKITIGVEITILILGGICIEKYKHKWKRI